MTEFPLKRPDHLIGDFRHDGTGRTIVLWFKDGKWYHSPEAATPDQISEIDLAQAFDIIRNEVAIQEDDYA